MTDELARRIAELMPKAKSDLAELVAIPSVADPRQYPPEHCREAAEWVAREFTAVGLHDVHLEETPDGSHAVIGHRPRRPAHRPCCSTATTTCSRRWTTRPGRPRRSS